MKEFILTWSIKNISYSWHVRGSPIESPPFCLGLMQNTTWKVNVYPRGLENNDYLSLRLHRMTDNGPENFALNVEFSCITADASEKNSYSVPGSFAEFQNHGYSSLTIQCFIQRHDLYRRKALYLPEDTLTLRLRMWTDEDVNAFSQNFVHTLLEIERIILVENINLENSVKKTFDIVSRSKDRALISISLLQCGDMLDVGIQSTREGKPKFSTCELSLIDKMGGRIIWEHKICFFDRPDASVRRLPFTNKVLPSENDDSDKSNYEFTADFIYSTGKEKISENHSVMIQSEFISTYIQSDPSRYQPDTLNISDSLTLADEPGLFDVKLKAEDALLNAHKAVLCARSPVFMIMLTSDMKEKESGYIEITDISADTLKLFRDFLYYDNINQFQLLPWNEAIELFYAAHKYKVERLKLLCCAYFLENIALANVCELLMLADRHDECDLKQAVNHIICRNDEIVFKSTAWRKLAEEQRQLALETMLSKYEGKGNQNPKKMYKEMISSHPKIQDDFRSLYLSGIATDCVIKTASSSFPAHKTVLCVNSSVFKDKLSKATGEKSADFIEILDLEDETVSTMLLFMYSNELKDVKWDTYKNLYHASHVYGVPKLRFKCSCYLIKNLGVSNACDLLSLAHDHSDFKLKAIVQDYICKYDEEILISDEWADFCEADSGLALETINSKYRRT